jgi:PAS domain S-box-containing protein
MENSGMGIDQLLKEMNELRRKVEILENRETDHKQAEEEIRKLSRAVSQSPSLIIITDTEGLIEYVNPKFTEVSGYLSEEVLGENVRLLKSGEVPDLNYTKMWDSLHAGKEWRGEFHNRKKNGEFFWVFASISPIYNDENEITHFVAIEENVTDQKRMEETLQASESRYRGIFEGVQDAILVESLAGEILDVNERACEMFGFSRDEMLTKTVDDLVPEGYLAIIPGNLVTPVIPENPMETINVRSNGEFFPVEITARLQEIGEEMVMLVVVRDITERKQVEKELEKSKLELEQSNTDLERFASIASHDMREPLRAISGFASLLLKRCSNQLDTIGEEYIDYILDGTKRLQELIDALLMYSRVGTKVKAFNPTDCEELLKGVTSSLTVAIEESSAVITHDPLPNVIGDRVQLEQLFQNILSNAIKFRGSKRPEIHIGLARIHNEWQFSVKDNGIGIEAQYHDRIFDIFQRLHTQTEYPGTGLGLAICKRIVERHGGRIWVESEPGSGSTFFFTIPINEICL